VRNPTLPLDLSTPADSQMSDVPGLFAAGECGAGLHGANRLGGNLLSDLLVFGKRAGDYAARYAQENSLGAINPDEVALAEKQALTPYARDGAEGPYQRHEPSGWLSCGQ
jgi:succinate dehydrogenase / fumarate reductase flavoprotein subunit